MAGCTVAPPEVDKGYISYGSLDTGAAWAASDVVVYKCYKFYGLVDDYRQTCSGGAWTGTLPKCEYHLKTEIVFWLVLVLLLLLLLLLLALIIFLCCYFCRCCKRCGKGGRDGRDEDVERGRRRRRRGSDDKSRKSRDKSPRRRNDDEDDESSGYCCACCGPRQKKEKSEGTRSRSPQRDSGSPKSGEDRMKDREEKEDTGCCACCYGSKTEEKKHKASRSRPPIRESRNDKDDKEEVETRCCTCCYGSKTKEKKPKVRDTSPQREESSKQARSRSPKRDGIEVIDDKEEAETGSCACCYGSKTKEKKPNARDTSPQREGSPKQAHSRSPKRDVLEVKEDDREESETGCCACCYGAKTKEKKTKVRDTSPQREGPPKQARSRSPKRDGIEVKDDKQEAETGCCACCYGSKTKEKKPKARDTSPQREGSPKQARSRSPKRDGIEVKDDKEKTETGCCACCYGAKTKEKKTKARDASPQREGSPKQARSRSPKEDGIEVKDDKEKTETGCCACCYGSKTKEKKPKAQDTSPQREGSPKQARSRSTKIDGIEVKDDKEEAKTGCCACCYGSKTKEKKHTPKEASQERKDSTKRRRPRSPKRGTEDTKVKDDEEEADTGCCACCCGSKKKEKKPRNQYGSPVLEESKYHKDDKKNERTDTIKKQPKENKTQEIKLSTIKDSDGSLVEEKVKRMQEEQQRKEQELERKRQKQIEEEKKRDQEKQEKEREREIQRQQQEELARIEEDKRQHEKDDILRERESERQRRLEERKQEEFERKREMEEKENERELQRQERLETERQRQEERLKELEEREKEREELRLQQQELAKQRAQRRKKERERKEEERKRRRKHFKDDYLENESPSNNPEIGRKKRKRDTRRTSVQPRYLDFMGDQTVYQNINRPYKPARPPFRI